jgi:hypothetical protein
MSPTLPRHPYIVASPLSTDAGTLSAFPTSCHTPRATGGHDMMAPHGSTTGATERDERARPATRKHDPIQTPADRSYEYEESGAQGQN